MNKMKKLLSVLLAVIMILSSMTVMASAAKTAYKTVDELTALDAYSPYGQVTRLSLEERTSIVFDALDNLLAKTNINMGTVFDVLGLSVTIDLTSIDRLCYSVDTIKDTFTNTLASIAMAIVNLGILESLEIDTWATGMSRDGTAQFTILSEILELLSANTTLVGKVFTDGLDLGLVSLGDMSAIEDIIMDLPGMVKGLVFPMLERWDDTLTEVKWLDTNGKGDGKVEETVNTFVKNLFNNDMSITTLKYDVNGNMTSEHTNWLATATGSAAPTVSDSSPRCYYQFSSTTPGSVMTIYHIVDEKEAEALAKDADDTNNVAAYNYIKEEQTYVMSQEVEGSETYVWKATDEWGNSWSLKWYNDDSQFLPGFSGDSIDLTTMSLADLLYTFIPHVFANMAPVVLNGSIKKVLADFLGASFKYVGQVGDDAVNNLPDASNAFFTEEQGEYLWEWSNYAVINGNHYYRFEDQIFVGDISQKNNYFDIINWDYEITDDFMNEFVPENGGSTSDTLLMNLNDFIIKVANTALKDSAATVDAISGFEAQWTKPALTAGGNENLVANIKAIAQAVIGLAPQHVFGSDYATNERCYVELMLSDDNDTVLTGIAAHIVNMVMPSVSLPGKSDLVASNAKVGAILAAVVREFAAYLAPEYNFDALIYADFGTTTDDPVKTFVDPTSLLTSGQTASGYWLDVIMTMGINVGYEYLRAFADMGEGSTQWTSFVSYSGYGVDGKTYTAGTTQAALNAEWEGMVDYILDWALTTDQEWCWAMANIVDCGATVDLSTAQDPWVKLDTILNALLPVDEILNITATDCDTELEQLLRYNLILAIVDLRWDDLADMLIVPDGFVRNDNVLDQLAAKLKGIVNYIFQKVGNSANNFALIPSVITDFDSLANQDNLVTMVKSIVGAIYNAGVTDGGCRTIFPFLNFLLGWKTDPQVIKDPEIWTSFRDGNDYAFQWTGQDGYPAIDASSTIIKVLNNSSGMLETHRNSSVTDHAYDIQIKSITDDATTNDLTYTYGDGNGLVSPYETLDIKIGGTYNGEEAATITIAYDYVGKDGSAIGGTQYTSITILFSNQYEDSNVDGRFDGDDDEDYTGIPQYKKFVFTEDIYASVTGYEQQVFFVKPTIDLTGTSSKSFGYVHAPDWTGTDCDGNATGYIDMTGNAATYFDYNDTQASAGWEDSVSDGNPAYGFLYRAADGVTAETFSEENSEANNLYGTYDMGQYCIKYGSGEKKINIDFIYYNSYGIYDIYTENLYNGYNANQGVDAAIYNEYNEAWKTIVYGATYPMMTEANGNSATDYVATIQPYIPAAIERFEAAKEAYEEALAAAQASASSDASLPAYVTALRNEIENDYVGDKEINFQDYDFYEYFSYNDEKVKGENLYRSYLAPSLMDTYYILNSGISEAELDLVIGAESNATKAAAITASRQQNDQAAIDAAQAAHDEWTQPVNTKLVVEDMTSRIKYYKQFLNSSSAEGTEHMYFLNQEIAFLDAQGLVEDDYTAASWAKYAECLEIAKAVAAGNDEWGYSNYNSDIYSVKYNLMVAYKNLLSKDASLIEAGGIADLLANIEIAEGILAMGIDEIELSDIALEKGLTKEQALGHLIEGLGYYYQARYSENDVEVENGEKAVGDLKYWDEAETEPMIYNLYADSAYEYADNDRPNNQNNQAKVNAANTNLEACIAYFAVAAEEPVLGGVDTGVVDTENGYVYGVVAGESDLTLFFTVENGTFEMVANEAGYTNGTGATLVVKNTKGEVAAEYTLVVFGDVNGDGAITMADYGMVSMASLGGTIDGEANNYAADVNGDASITMADYGIVNMASLGGAITVNPYEAA